MKVSAQEAARIFASDRAMFEKFGFITRPEASSYVTDDMKYNESIAMDALPVLATTPNADLLSLMSYYVDSTVVDVIFAPLEATEIMDERKAGDWLTDTFAFPLVEATGEVSAYGDFIENGRAGINANFPQYQSHHFQVICEYGEREIGKAGLAKLNYVAQVDRAAASNLSRFQNFSYFFGVAGLQNYGLLNDPLLSAALTPGIKSAGGNKWVTSTGAINATPNEVYADVQALFLQLVTQTAGNVKQKDPMVLALSPQSGVALTAANSFGTSVGDLLQRHFPNLKIVTATQYGVQSALNPQGNLAGNFAQLIAEKLDANETLFCSFTEKMRAHKIEQKTSSYKQKKTSGTWGAIIRYPIAIAQMVGL